MNKMRQFWVGTDPDGKGAFGLAFVGAPGLCAAKRSPRSRSTPKRSEKSSGNTSGAAQDTARFPPVAVVTSLGAPARVPD